MQPCVSREQLFPHYLKKTRRRPGHRTAEQCWADVKWESLRRGDSARWAEGELCPGEQWMGFAAVRIGWLCAGRQPREAAGFLPSWQGLT